MKRYVIKRPAGSQVPDRLARYREELNEEQFAVATAPAGAALVIAGAGSGKTRAITYRVAYLIEQGVAPARIMLATFTNRAAREMLRRVEQLTGGGGDVARASGAAPFTASPTSSCAATPTVNRLRRRTTPSSTPRTRRISSRSASTRPA